MKEILQNLALIHLNKFCMANQIDIEGTYLLKERGEYAYSLIKDRDRLATVWFSKSSTPTYSIPFEHPEWIAAEKRGIITP